MQKNSSGNFARAALRGVVWTTLGNYAAQAIAFGAVLVLTRLLAPASFGAFALAGFWLSLLNLRQKAGLNYAAIQYPTLDGSLLGTYFVIDMTLAALSAVITSVVAVFLYFNQIADIQILTVMISLTLIECVSTLASPFAMALEKEMQFSRVTLAQVIVNILAYGIAIFLAWRGYGIWSLVAINAITMPGSALFSFWLCKRRLPKIFAMKPQFSKQLVKKLLSNGVEIGASVMLQGTIIMQYDNFLIGTFVNQSMLGFYDRAYKIANWVSLILNIGIGRVGYVTMTKIKDDIDRLSATVDLALWIVLTAGLPLMLIIVFGASEIIQLLYGNRYLQSIDFLRFLAASSFGWTLVNITSWFAIATEGRKFNLRVSILQAALLVGAGTPLTILFGVNGTLLAVGITMLTGVTIGLVFMFRRVKLSFAQVFGSHFVALIGCVAALVVWQQTILFEQLPLVLRFLSIGCLSLIIFGSILMALRKDEISSRVQFLSRIWR